MKLTPDAAFVDVCGRIRPPALNLLASTTSLVSSWTRNGADSDPTIAVLHVSGFNSPPRDIKSASEMGQDDVSGPVLDEHGEMDGSEPGRLCNACLLS